MNLLLLASAYAYEVQFTAVPYGGRQHWGYETASGAAAEVPILSFHLDSPEISGIGDEYRMTLLRVRWKGDASAVGEMRIWEDDGDELWSASADTLLDTVDAVAPFETYEWVPSAAAGLVHEKTDRDFHITVVLDPTLPDDPDAGSCTVLWGVVPCIELADDVVLHEPEVRGLDGNCNFDVVPEVLDSMGASSDAFVVERAVLATVAEQPESQIVAGYPATAELVVQHCDGVAVPALTATAPALVRGPYDDASQDVASLPVDGTFALTWTTPTDAWDTWTFRIGDDVDADGQAEQLAVDGDGGTLVWGPASVVVSTPFETIANPGFLGLEDVSDQAIGTVGEPIAVRMRLTDQAAVAVAGEQVSLSIVDALGDGLLSTSSAATDALGEVTVDWTLSTRSGQNALLAEVDGRGVQLVVQRFGTPLEPSAETSTLQADPVWTLASGGDEVSLTVAVRDAYGNPVSGAVVALSHEGVGALSSEGGASDENGAVQVALSSSDVGFAVVGAEADGVSLEPVKVEFRPVPETGFYGDPWPNPIPVDGVATVQFALAADSDVVIALYDVTGRLVNTLSDSHIEAGYHDLEVSMLGLPPEAYVLRLVAGEEVDEVVLVVAGSGCGCSSGEGSATGAFSLLAALAVGWRRRR